eukprot:bmy_01848T0
MKGPTHFSPKSLKAGSSPPGTGDVLRVHRATAPASSWNFTTADESYPASWPGWTPTVHLPHGIPALLTAYPACGAKQGSPALLPLGSEAAEEAQGPTRTPTPAPAGPPAARASLPVASPPHNQGRGGKGSIYVWASGDGGSYDDCNCDGYASSMWTISINSAINDGRTALYDESCSSTLASTFSNGRKRNPEAGVATTDLYGNCTLRHSGTSAAAPEAAGVFALALEANLGLTWRDMQHLTVLTSKRNQLHDEVHQWRRNGVGLEFNHLFGYGVLDAGAMVKMAKDWKTVPERFHCVGGSVQDPEKIPPTGKLVLTLTTAACEGKENFVRYLEHVQAVVTVNATRRGDLNINMTSPMGTKSILLSRRPRDDDAKVGFDKWPFMTTHTWGEDARGTWTLELGFVGSAPQKGVLKEWTLMLHGTQSAPYIDQVVRDYQSKLAMSKKEELEDELDEAVERSLKSILGEN